LRTVGAISLGLSLLVRDAAIGVKDHDDKGGQREDRANSREHEEERRNRLREVRERAVGAVVLADLAVVHHDHRRRLDIRCAIGLERLVDGHVSAEVFAASPHDLRLELHRVEVERQREAREQDRGEEQEARSVAQRFDLGIRGLLHQRVNADGQRRGEDDGNREETEWDRHEHAAEKVLDHRGARLLLRVHVRHLVQRVWNETSAAVGG
jgi:hypothetical protein